MATAKSLILKIDEDQGAWAKALSSKMSTPKVRKKGMIDLLGITSVINFFQASKIKVSLTRSLHKTPLLFEEFKVTDIYYNNHRMDVVTVFREKKIRIPRIHAELDIVSDFYVVTQIGSMLKEAKILGYFSAVDVLNSRHDNKYFYPPEDRLRPIEELIKYIKNPRAPKPMQGKHLECVSLFLRFLDGELSNSHKKELLSHILTCESCLKRLEDLIEFDRAAAQTKKYPNTVEKYYQKIASTPIKAQKEGYPDIVVKKSDKQGGDIIINPIKIVPPKPKKKPSQEQRIGLARPASLDEKQKVLQKDVPTTLKNTAIELIFNKENKDFEAGENIVIKDPAFEKKKKVAILFTLVFVAVFAVAGLIFKGMSALAPISDVSNTAAQEQSSVSYDDIASGNVDGSQMYDDFGAQTLPSPDNSSGIIDYEALSHANGEPVIANINKISWEVPENVAEKDSYTKFLQNVGKNIKLNLQNDLLMTNDVAKNNNIKVDIRFSSSGNVENIKVKEGSGSGQIDNIIKKSINDTLSYIKPPNLGFMGKSVVVTLIIGL